MPKDNSLTTFLQFLKLGICKEGPIEGWGTIQSICTYPDDFPGTNYFMKKQPEQYLNDNRFFRKQLGIGVYLHDYYLFQSVVQGNRRLSTFIVVISCCRLKGVFDEKLYYLRVTNRQRSDEFKQTVLETASSMASTKQIKLRRSYQRMLKPQSHDNGPLAVNRKMK